MLNDALAGKKVLLTHSGDGLGFVIAIAFAQAGAEVVIHDNSAAVVAAAVERLALAVPGCRVLGGQADLSTVTGVRQILAYAGPVDILVIDALTFGVVDFSGLDDQEAGQDRQVLRDRAGRLLDDFVSCLEGPGPTTLLLLSLASTPVDESGTSWVSHQAGGANGKPVTQVHAASVRDLILAPVADLVKSEVLRTNGTLAEVSERLMRDHRPAAIEAGLATIQALIHDIVKRCTDRQ